MNIKQKAYQVLPLQVPVKMAGDFSANFFVTVSLKRSGQHAIINWLCGQMQPSVHFNDCNFIRSRFSMSPVSCKVTSYGKNENNIVIANNSNG